jgi:hypothetical protein
MIVGSDNSTENACIKTYRLWNWQVVAFAGNMWAQSWENIYDIVKPYTDATGVDVTKNLNDQVSYWALSGAISIL